MGQMDERLVRAVVDVWRSTAQAPVWHNDSPLASALRDLDLCVAASDKARLCAHVEVDDEGEPTGGRCVLDLYHDSGHSY